MTRYAWPELNQPFHRKVTGFLSFPPCEGAISSGQTTRRAVGLGEGVGLNVGVGIVVAVGVGVGVLVGVGIDVLVAVGVFAGVRVGVKAGGRVMGIEAGTVAVTSGPLQATFDSKIMIANAIAINDTTGLSTAVIGRERQRLRFS